MKNTLFTLFLSVGMLHGFSNDHTHARSSGREANLETNQIQTHDSDQAGNDLIVYWNDSIQIENFMFAPFDSNLIWTFNTNGQSYELNLKDSTWTDLKFRWGSLARSLKKESIVTDPFSNKIWILNFHQGLMRYNPDDNTSVTFKQIKPISSIRFTEKWIIVGTWRGLYIIDRSTDEVKKSNSIAEVAVRDIQMTWTNMWLINEKFVYDYRTDAILETRETRTIYEKREEGKVSITNYEITDGSSPNIRIKHGDVEKWFMIHPFKVSNALVEENAIWMLKRSLRQGLIRYDLSSQTTETITEDYQFRIYKMTSDEEHIWFCNEGGFLTLNKETRSFRLYKHRGEGRIQNIIEMGKSLYYNTWHSIEILPKKQMHASSTALEHDKSELLKFKSLQDSLGVYDYRKPKDLKQRHKDYVLAQRRFGKSTNTKIIKELERMKDNVGNIGYGSNDIHLKGYVDDSINDPSIKSKYYLNMIRLQNQSGGIVNSLKLDSVLIEQLPEYREDYHIRQMDKVREAYLELKAINESDAEEDLKLWKRGSLYYKLFLSVGPVSEGSSYIMTYPFRYYDTLLLKYPSSEYADNAEFKMLAHEEGGSHEGGDNSFNVEAIKLYESLIEKYPDTDLKATIYRQIAYLTWEAYGNIDERRQQLRSGISYLDKAKNIDPAYYQEKDLDQLKKELEKSLSRFMWKLSIESDQKVYSIGDDIMIAFSIENIDTKEKSIAIPEDSTIPAFTLHIEKYPLNDRNYGPTYMRLESSSQTYNRNRLKKLIPINESYSEKWDITKVARASLRDAPGKFVFNEYGRYKIYAQASDNGYDRNIRSEPIWIEVIN